MVNFSQYGKPLEFKQITAEIRVYLRQHGTVQFLRLYRSGLSRRCDPMKYGFEVETLLVKRVSGHWKLSLSNETEIQKLTPGLALSKEFAKFQLEAMPEVPLCACFQQLVGIQSLFDVLVKEHSLALMTVFPTFGREGIYYPEPSKHDELMQSKWIPDDVISTVPRFNSLIKSIKERRGRLVQLRGTELDCMAAGMGMCGLQVTFQCYNERESRYIYDQLQCVAPLMMAVTAATPIIHGKLQDTDSRYSFISDSVDDRTKEEMQSGVLPRFGPCYHFISPSGSQFNDLKFSVDQPTLKQLREGGVDEQLAMHVASLFWRDPLVVFEQYDQVNDATETAHFDQFQSTNWHYCRWKPALNDGWQVEFRPMEVQASPFDNTALVLFVFMLTRAVRAFDLSLYLPQSTLIQEFEKSQTQNASLNQLFSVAANPFGSANLVGADVLLPRPQGAKCDCGQLPFNVSRAVALAFRSEVRSQFAQNLNHSDKIRKLTASQILRGTQDYPGLIPLINFYIDLCIKYQLDPGAMTANSGEINTPPTVEEGAFIKKCMNRVAQMAEATQAWRMRGLLSTFGHKDGVISQNVSDQLVDWAVSQQECQKGPDAATCAGCAKQDQEKSQQSEQTSEEGDSKPEQIRQRANSSGLSIFDSNFNRIICPISITPVRIKQSQFLSIQSLSAKFADAARKIALQPQLLDSLAKFGDELTLKLLDLLSQKKRKTQDSDQKYCGVAARADFLFENGVPFLVECNTIAAGMAPLGTLTEALVNKEEKGIKRLNNGLQIQTDFFHSIVQRFQNEERVEGAFLIVQQRGETNALDQLILRDALIQRGVRVLMDCYGNLKTRLNIDQAGRLLLDGAVIASVYYRSCYNLEDYENDFETRLTMETAKTYSFPGLEMQLAGMKPLQPLYEQQTPELSQNSKKIYYCSKLPAINYDNFVLKSSAEGGGACVFGGQAIQQELEHLSPEQLEQRFLMEKIVSDDSGELLFCTETNTSLHKHTAVEIGIFNYGTLEGIEITGGYLARAKDINTNEGGVHCGAAVSAALILD